MVLLRVLYMSCAYVAQLLWRAKIVFSLGSCFRCTSPVLAKTGENRGSLTISPQVNGQYEATENFFRTSTISIDDSIPSQPQVV